MHFEPPHPPLQPSDLPWAGYEWTKGRPAEAGVRAPAQGEVEGAEGDQGAEGANGEEGLIGEVEV